MKKAKNERSKKAGAPLDATGNAVELLMAGHPFVKGLKPEHQRLLVENAMTMFYEKDQYIFRDGDPANRFYLILEGRVSLEAPRRHEPPVELQVLGPGDVLGWSWLFPPYSWQFDARTLEPTKAIFFYGTRLREEAELDHDFGFELMKRVTQVVVQRLQATRKQLLSAQK